MRSIWSINKIAVDAQTRVGSAETKADSIAAYVNSMYSSVVGSTAFTRFINVASVPATIPSAGIPYFDTTRKCLVVSNGTSFYLATGSVA